MKQAMIFAAGLGTRLRPLTNDRPKALVEVAGRTLLEHTILKLRNAGFDRIVVNVHHFADQIEAFLQAHDNFGLDIRLSDERQQLLDTGGGVKAALDLIDRTEPLLIHNVDIVSDIDLDALYQAYVASVAQNPSAAVGAALAVNRRSTSRYLMFGPENSLCGWTNINTGEVKGTMGQQMAFAGIHVVGPALYPLLQQEGDAAFPIVPFYIKACQTLTLTGYDVTGNAWVDCGKVESLERAARILLT